MKPAVAAEDTIVQEILIHAPAEKIFSALTDPQALLKWWGVEGKFRVIRLDSDLRPGGKWFMELTSSTCASKTVHGEYRRIDPPNALTYSWIRDQISPLVTEVRWDLEREGASTRVRVTHSGLVTPELRSTHDGWPIILGLLQAHAEGRS